MGAKTSIGWTDATHNPVSGCEIESPGCTNCYAMGLCGTRLSQHPMYGGTTRTVNGKHVFNGVLKEHPNPDVFQWPVRWKGSKTPRLGAGAPSMIFVCDMSDLFHPNRPLETIDKVVDPCVASKHICQFLTKRPSFMADYFLHWSKGLKGLANNRFWLGFSAEDQTRFNERWPHMRKLAEAGWIVFCSYEPAIGPLVLPTDFLAFREHVWIIIGGESGPHARLFNLAWAEDVITQCAPWGVPVFNKQAGSKPIIVTPPEARLQWGAVPVFKHKKGEDMDEWPEWLRVRQFPWRATGRSRPGSITT